MLPCKLIKFYSLTFYHPIGICTCVYVCGFTFWEGVKAVSVNYIYEYIILPTGEVFILQGKKKCIGVSKVAQWLRIFLPMQGTWVRALVWEDPTSCGATKPVHHDY